MRVTELASAKINLTLTVRGKRPDGYHEIASLVAFARDAADIVELDTEKPQSIEVSGPFGGSISGENLVALTVEKIKRAAPSLALGAIRLTKNLPVAAGIGGGSADAAAVLRAVQRANGEASLSIDWYAIATSLGADVPVCYANAATWMTGIGESLHPVADLPPLAAVLVNPLQPMPADKTAQVFRALAAGLLATDSTAPPPPGRFQNAAALIEFLKDSGNDLTAPASLIAPIMQDMMRALADVDGAAYVSASGAGPTCFAIVDDAATAAASLKNRHPTWWVQPVTLA